MKICQQKIYYVSEMATIIIICETSHEPVQIDHNIYFFHIAASYLHRKSSKWLAPQSLDKYGDLFIMNLLLLFW